MLSKATEPKELVKSVREFVKASEMLLLFARQGVTSVAEDDSKRKLNDEVDGLTAGESALSYIFYSSI